MAGQNTRIALIGCGMWGRNIARNLHELGALAALVDTSTARAATLRDAIAPDSGDSIRLMESAEAAIGDDTIDAIAIATPPAAHAAIAIPALKAGKPVFVEKPLAISLADAEAIAEAERASPAPLMVGHLIRYHPVFARLLSMVKEGAIGSIRHIRACRIAAGRIRSSESVLYDLVCHDLALIAALTDSATPRHVAAMGASHVTQGIDDIITARLVFDPNITAHIEAGWYHPVKQHMLSVIGEGGALVFDDTKPWEEKLAHFPGFTITRDEDDICITDTAPVMVSVPPDEPLKCEMRAFIAAAQGKSAPLTDITEALHVQRLLHAIEKAAAGDAP